jgi:hypothetical protein
MVNKSRILSISKPCINISVIECHKCMNDMIVAYYSDDIVIPYGPGGFTDHQIDIARQEGCVINKAFSKTNDTSNFEAVCPVCGSIMEEYLYHEFANIPGDVQYFLDEKDEILEKIMNRKVEIRTLSDFDETVNRKDSDVNEGSDIYDSTSIFNKGICVLVKFDRFRMYHYNCRFDIKLGDKVIVDGKMSGKLGEIVEIIGEWDLHENMKEVVEIIPSIAEDNTTTEKSIQQIIDHQNIEDDKSDNEQFIAGFDLEYWIVIDESDHKSPIKVLFDTFDLCNETFNNTEMLSSATVKSHYFEVYAISVIQCKDSLGGEFTCYERYVFDRVNTKKFYQSLSQSFDFVILSEIIKLKFGGPSGLKTLEAYCKENDITYDYTHRYQE